MVFRGQYIKLHGKIITSLDENTLMTSKTHNYLLGECFCIDHTEKKVYFGNQLVKISNLIK